MLPAGTSSLATSRAASVRSRAAQMRMRVRGLSAANARTPSPASIRLIDQVAGAGKRGRPGAVRRRAATVMTTPSMNGHVVSPTVKVANMAAEPFDRHRGRSSRMGSCTGIINALKPAARDADSANSQLNRKRGRNAREMARAPEAISNNKAVIRIPMERRNSISFGCAIRPPHPLWYNDSCMILRNRHAVLAILSIALLYGCAVPWGQASPPSAGHASNASVELARPRSVVAAAYLMPAPTAAATRTRVPSALSPQVTPVKTEEAGATGTATQTPVINPFTGMPAGDVSLLNRRPLAVKISNYPRDIRPQYGLNEADVVFEYYIEWGYTRFIGIFYGNNATKIGPGRSGRYFDEHIMRMYHAFYVFNFADPREYRYFLGGDLAKYMVVPGGNCDVAPFFTSRGSSVTGDASHFECYFDST